MVSFSYQFIDFVSRFRSRLAFAHPKHITFTPNRHFELAALERPSEIIYA